MTFRRFSLLLIDCIMVTRPVILIPVWGFCALGFRSGVQGGSDAGISACWHRISLNDYGLLLVFSLSVAAVYVMNQLADIDVDKRNGGMPLIARGIVSKRAAWVVIAACGAISLFIPLWFHRYMLAVTTVITLIVGYVYCFKPFRFSGRPVVDFLSNAFGYGIVAFGAGWCIAGRELLSNLFMVNALPYFFLMCGGSISSTLPDIEGDRADNKNTTAVVFGIIPSHILAMVFICLAAATGLLRHDVVAIFCAALSLPLYIAYLLVRKKVLMEATYKIGGALCMVAAFIALPLFIPAAFIVFCATWLYFRIRHGISYPSLNPSTDGT